MKTSESKENVCVRVVIDYVDMWFSNFAIEYLCENEKDRNTIFACSYGAQVESFKQKLNCQKSRDTVPLTLLSLSSYCTFHELSA